MLTFFGLVHNCFLLLPDGARGDYRLRVGEGLSNPDPDRQHEKANKGHPRPEPWDTQGHLLRHLQHCKSKYFRSMLTCSNSLFNLRSSQLYPSKDVPPPQPVPTRWYFILFWSLEFVSMPWTTYFKKCLFVFSPLTTPILLLDLTTSTSSLQSVTQPVLRAKVGLVHRFECHNVF